MMVSWDWPFWNFVLNLICVGQLTLIAILQIMQIRRG